MSLPLHTLSQLAANAHMWLTPVRAHVIAAAQFANVPNPPPASPGPASGAVTTLLAWLKWLALAACAASAIAAGGMIAVGSVTRRSELAARGKAGLVWSVIGAIVVGVGIPLVNHAFKLG
jgi:hypothetical protein